jgi:hypothetical protein
VLAIRHDQLVRVRVESKTTEFVDDLALVHVDPSEAQEERMFLGRL